MVRTKQALSLRWRLLCPVLALLLLLLLPAGAEQAREITQECSHPGMQNKTYQRITDHKFDTGYKIESNRSITVSHEGGISGITL